MTPPFAERILWTNTQFSADIDGLLHRSIAPLTLRYASHRSSSNLASTPHDPILDEAEVAFGQPNAEQIMASKKLRWVHLTSAGYTNYDRSDLRQIFAERGIALTTSSGVYDEPCAQHLLAMLLSMSRQLQACSINQLTAKEWPAAEIRANSFLLQGQSVIIYGYGEIAKRLAEMLAPFGMQVTGVRRNPRGDESVPVVAIEDSDEWLARADHVLNILPANEESHGFFHAQRLSRIKPEAIFYNIGRGATVDQVALAERLNQGLIAGAYLDVTQPEPLPPADPLWTAKNCWITPHSAGGFTTEMQHLVQHFASNLKLYLANKPLLNRVV